MAVLTALARRESALDRAYTNCEVVMKGAPAAPFLGSDFALVQERAKQATISQVFTAFLRLAHSSSSQESERIKKVFIYIKLIAVKDPLFAGGVDLRPLDVLFEVTALNRKAQLQKAKKSEALRAKAMSQVESLIVQALEFIQLCKQHAETCKRMIEFARAGFAHRNIILQPFEFKGEFTANDILSKTKKSIPFEAIEGLMGSEEFIGGKIVNFGDFEFASFIIRWMKIIKHPQFPDDHNCFTVIPNFDYEKLDFFINKFKNHKREDVRLFARFITRVYKEHVLINSFQVFTSNLCKLFSSFQNECTDVNLNQLCMDFKIDGKVFFKLYAIIKERHSFYLSLVNAWPLDPDKLQQLMQEFQNTLLICEELKSFSRTCAFVYRYNMDEFTEIQSRKKVKRQLAMHLPLPAEVESLFLSVKGSVTHMEGGQEKKREQKAEVRDIKKSGVLTLFENRKDKLQAHLQSAGEVVALQQEEQQGANALIAALGAPLSAPASASAPASSLVPPAAAASSGPAANLIAALGAPLSAPGPASAAAPGSAAASVIVASASAAGTALSADATGFQVVVARKRQIPPEVRALFAKRKLPFVPTYHSHLATQRDKHHAFSKLVDRFVGTSYSKMSEGKSRKGDEIYIYQIAGEIDGVRGTFEYFFTLKGLLIHRFFNARNAQDYLMRWDEIDAGAMESSEALLQGQEAGVKWETQEEGGVSIDDLDLVTIEDALAPGTIRLVNLAEG